MSQRKISKRRRKNRCIQYFLRAGILFLIVVYAGVLLKAGFEKMKERDGAMGELPLTVTQNDVQAMERIETTVTETAYGGLENEAADTPWNLVLVNNSHPVPENYHTDLVAVAGGEYVDERIYEPLMEMLEDAREGNLGELPMVVSGYRTQEVQQRLFDDKAAEFKKEGCSDSEALDQAKQWVSVPGYSEHQLGLAVDINGASYDVYLWLQENCYQYGFIFRYPGNKTVFTGVAEEVWHYRYVGTEAAREIYEKGICLEEYLEEQNLK